MSTENIKFAYWVPNVSGGLVISDIEQRTSWDIDYNRKLARLAENSGFDYALSQIRFTAGYGAAEGDRGAAARAVEPGARGQAARDHRHPDQRPCLCQRRERLVQGRVPR